jgi:hypothetical protein
MVAGISQINLFPNVKKLLTLLSRMMEVVVVVVQQKYLLQNVS